MQGALRNWVLSAALVLATTANAGENRLGPVDGLVTADGKLDTGAFAGKVVYLDFWASWCRPCRKSFPWMEQLNGRLAERGLVIIAVNLDRDIREAQKFLDRMAPSFQTIFDRDARMARAYDLDGMPCAFLYDRNGQLKSTHVGFRDADRETLEREILALIDAGEGATP